MLCLTSDSILIFAPDYILNFDDEVVASYCGTGGNHSLRIAVCEENRCQDYLLIDSDSGGSISSWMKPSHLEYDPQTNELIVGPIRNDELSDLNVFLRIKPDDLEHWEVRYYGSLWDERKIEA